MKLKVLVACEYSGTVRDAFEDAGCDAWSCDILPTESEQTKAAGKHFKGSITKLMNYYKDSNKDSLKENKDFYGDEKKCHCAVYDKDYKLYCLPKFDLLIGHPPCTFLSFAYTAEKRYSPERLQEKIHAYQFFLDLWNAPVAHICLENPMGYAHSGLLPCTQIVEPYYFGHDYKKKTCLWLKNLPKLTYSLTDTLFEEKTAGEPTKIFLDNMNKKKRAGREYVLRPFSTKKERSRFHTGIARAMAEQWTEYINQIKNLI